MRNRAKTKSNNLIQSSKNKILPFVLTFLVSFIACLDISIAEPLAQKTIGISQIVEHPALDAVRESMLAALKAEGYEAGKNLRGLFGFEIRVIINAAKTIVQQLKKRQTLYERPTFKFWHWPQVLLTAFK